MTTEHPAQTTLRRVLTAAIASFVLGAGAVVLLAIDKSLAPNGRSIPSPALRATKWLGLALGIAAVLLWVRERLRTRTRVTAGLVIALVAVVATPATLAILEPDDIPTTVLALDAATGRQRWHTDVDLLYAVGPLGVERGGYLAINGVTPNRCETTNRLLTLDAAGGKRLTSRAVARRAPTPDPLLHAPLAVGGVRLEVVHATAPRTGQVDTNTTVRARDAGGRILWSAYANSDFSSPLVYADDAVVAFFEPKLPSSDPPGSFGLAFDVAVVDLHTGGRRWTLHQNGFAPALFDPVHAFAIEAPQIVVHDTRTGKVVARHPLATPRREFLDAQLLRTGDDVVLVEGNARRVTRLDQSGRLRWTATLPRVMTFADSSVDDGTIYIAGGGRFGYKCGGE